MQLIVPRIPVSTTVADLKTFLKPALTSWWPFAKVKDIDRYKIVIYKDSNTNVIEHHAILFVQDTALAKKICRKLNRKRLLGKHVAVREYFVRSWKNDRRLTAGLKSVEPPDSRRKGDRRRGNRLIEISHTPVIYGVKEFSRKMM